MGYYQCYGRFRKERLFKGKEEGEKIGIEKGRAEGLAESRKETAIAILKEGMPVDLAAKISKLSIEEVEKIKATLQFDN